MRLDVGAGSSLSLFVGQPSVDDPPHEQWLVRLGCWMVGSSSVIKKARILRLVKRTMKGEETYLLDFEILSNMRASC